MIKSLSNKEQEILQFIKQKNRNISEVSKELNIDYKNTHRYCTKLYVAGLIRIEPSNELRKKGKPVTLIYNDEQEVNKIIRIILKEIKILGGEINFKEFMELPKTIKQNPTNLPKIAKAKAILTMYFNPYLEEVRKLTPEGIKFLKERKWTIY